MPCSKFTIPKYFGSNRPHSKLVSFFNRVAHDKGLLQKLDLIIGQALIIPRVQPTSNNYQLILTTSLFIE